MARNFDTLARKTMSEAALRKAEGRAREILAEVLLSELRQATGATQKKLAGMVSRETDRLGSSQAACDDIA